MSSPGGIPRDVRQEAARAVKEGRLPEGEARPLAITLARARWNTRWSAYLQLVLSPILVVLGLQSDGWARIAWLALGAAGVAIALYALKQARLARAALLSAEGPPPPR